MTDSHTFELDKIKKLTVDLPFYSSLANNQLMCSNWSLEKYSVFSYLKAYIGNWIADLFNNIYKESIEEAFQPYIDGYYDKVHTLNSRRKTSELACNYEDLLCELNQFPHLFCTTSTDKHFTKTEFFDVAFGHKLSDMNLLRVRITKR